MQGIKHHKESFFHTRFWIAVLLVICGVLSVSVYKIYKKYNHAKTIRDDYRAELEQVKDHRADLQKNIDALSTERGKEEEIRDRYRVVKEGEQMILIVDNDKKEPKIPESENEVHTSGFQRIWNKILSIFR